MEAGPDYWTVTQAILANDPTTEYSLRGRVDLRRSREERRPILLLEHIDA